MPLTPPEFVAYWRDTPLNELAAYQIFFNGLCELVGHAKPGDPGTDPMTYRFEQPVKKPGGQPGRADVFKKGYWAWEFKDRSTKNLEGAYEQLLTYRDSLENPPLLIACNLEKFLIRTAFSNAPSKAHVFTLEALTDPATLELLKNAFHDPERLNPAAGRERVTTQAAAKIGELARNLEARGVPSAQTNHFLMQVVFALFAEDARLLPAKLVTKILERTTGKPDRARQYLSELFTAMAHGGEVLLEDVPHFNGGLFGGDTPVPPLEPADLDTLRAAAQLAWEEVEPSIFGTLFERALDPRKRAQLGAHYTSREDINLLVEPVILEPLRSEWREIKDRADAAIQAQKTGKARVRDVDEPVTAFITKLHTLRVLDPACGSGNFLYVAMQALKTFERDVIAYSQSVGVGGFLTLGPKQFYGLEVNPLAWELASVVVWIGYLQWMNANGYTNYGTPILQRLDNIKNVDALLDSSSGEVRERQWPEAEFIVGNPPFLGDKKMRRELGDAYVNSLRELFEGRVPGQADFVCYWFEKSRAVIELGTTKRAGLIATNSIRGGKNRVVLERINGTGAIFYAWSDRDWILEGAAVRVSMVAFDDGSESKKALDGLEVSSINADLSVKTDVSLARPLQENLGLMFQGLKLVGDFVVTAQTAQSWISLPNPSGRSNRDVLKPYINGKDIVQRMRNVWVIDFNQMPVSEASEYLAPFEHVSIHVKPERELVRRDATRLRWWIHGEARPGMRRALLGLSRFIATSQVSKHRIFVWLDAEMMIDGTNYALARDDDFTFGILHSRVHEVWSLKQGTALGVGNDPRYTPSTCFETFPFPRPTEAQRLEIERWAKYLHDVRSALMNADSTRTLTGIYNDLVRLRATRDSAHPVYALLIAHERLDAAVLGAYGWDANTTDDAMLERLLALNLERGKMPSPTA
jgi:hypothetical protein